MKKILFVCTGNSCRSQMAEGLAKNMGWHAFSAGTKPEIAVSQNAITAMNEIGIDISTHYPKLLNKINLSEIDVIMTVCSNADKRCPVFPGFEGEKIHYSFKDPADTIGTYSEILIVFKQIRDEIRSYLKKILIN